MSAAGEPETAAVERAIAANVRIEESDSGSFVRIVGIKQAARAVLDVLAPAEGAVERAARAINAEVNCATFITFDVAERAARIALAAARAGGDGVEELATELAEERALHDQTIRERDAFAARGDAAPTVSAEVPAEVAKAVHHLTALLGEFYEPGHPGRPCHRTGWLSDTFLSDLRKVAADAERALTEVTR